MRRILGVLFAVILVFPSCENFIDPEINVDPNNPTEVPMELILPAAQVRFAYSMQGDFTRIPCIWIQQWSGTVRQSFGFERYNVVSTDLNNLWNAMYAGTLQDLKKLMEQADEEESPHFKGAAQVLFVIGMQMVTDIWGDVPYEEAFLGVDNISPSYSSQQSIYTELNTMIDNAITNLGAADNAVDLSGDLMYGGDTDAWIAAAYAVKARLAVHLSKVNGNSAYTDALAAVSNAMSSNAGDMIINFLDSESGAHPIYQFDDQRGDIVVGEYLVDACLATSDPRLAVLAAPNTAGEFVGSPAGDPASDPSRYGPFYNSRNAPCPFITYAEMKFIEAEATYFTGTEADAKTALSEAVAASTAFYGVDTDGTWQPTYDATLAALTGNDLLKEIMVQKYIALFAQAEAYNDWRRHDNILGLSPSVGNVNNNVIPRRVPYTSDELAYNEANVPTANLSSKVWWDQ